MSHSHVSLPTPDGICPASVFTPDGVGPWPAVIFFADGMGIRPAIDAMAERLASAGYVVLLPDLYYRAGTYGPLVPKDLFAAGTMREVVGPLMGTTGNLRAAGDTAVFLAYLASLPDVTPGKCGVVGYCMSGAIALTVAAMYPDRVAAVASFHGGNLATDADDSPHRLAPQITARIYVAGADEDASYPPEMAARLEAALSAAGADFRCETYAGARHGWTMTDFPIYDAAMGERHWRELVGLFDSTLKH